jgi:short-subunit dehydrogenase
MEQRGQVVVVTGASAGVGRACAIRFARTGARLALIARGRAGLEGARREVEAAGAAACITLQCDVSDAGAVEAAAERIEHELGAIEIWINAAMVTVFGEFKDVSADEFRRVTEVTYLGYVHGTKSALSRMLTRDRGTIVQVGSALAYRSIPLQSAYCGAKHAIHGFTESLRCELMHYGSRVRLSMVQMPALNTPQFAWSRNKTGHKAQPVPPIYQPEVAADGVYTAVRRRRREMFLGFPSVLAIEGEKIAPWLGDRYLARTGFDSQQHDGPSDPDRGDNLFAAMDEERDYGTHGSFDQRAHASSPQLWLSKHRSLALAVVAAALATGLGAAAGLRQRQRWL